MKSWQAQEAKMRFGDLIKNALISPQLITVRGHPEVVVLSTEEYSKLTKPELSVFDVMQKFPHKNFSLKTKRSKDKSLRKINL